MDFVSEDTVTEITAADKSIIYYVAGFVSKSSQVCFTSCIDCMNVGSSQEDDPRLKWMINYFLAISFPIQRRNWSPWLSWRTCFRKNLQRATLFERRGLACALESRPSQWKECKGGTLPLKVRPKKEVSRICKAYEDKLKFSTINVVEKTTRPKLPLFKKTRLSKIGWKYWTSEVLSHDLHEFLVDSYAKTRSATMGMILPAMIVGVNFILRQSEAKIKRAEGHLGHLNTGTALCYRHTQKWWIWHSTTCLGT